MGALAILELQFSLKVERFKTRIDTFPACSRVNNLGKVFHLNPNALRKATASWNLEVTADIFKILIWSASLPRASRVLLGMVLERNLNEWKRMASEGRPAVLRVPRMHAGYDVYIFIYLSGRQLWPFWLARDLRHKIWEGAACRNLLVLVYFFYFLLRLSVLF